jgi:putative hydrolase of the HAD superfamily
VKEVLIFDLDNCLAPATEVGAALYEPAFEAIRRANQGVLDAAALENAIADCWKHPLDWVAARHGFSAAMLQAGRDAFRTIEVTQPLNGYPDIDIVRKLPGHRHLVTTGFRRLQASKIRALGIASWFDGIHIDAIDEPDRVGKQGLFERILAGGPWRPEQALVIGDNPESELAAARRLGIDAVQTLRPGVTRSDVADHHVTSLDQLFSLLSADGKTNRNHE